MSSYDTKQQYCPLIFHFVVYCSFKQEVGACLKREKGLEQSKAQLQLDWEARMEEVERKAYGKHQQIIQQLTEAKDKVSVCVCVCVCVCVVPQ